MKLWLSLANIALALSILSPLILSQDSDDLPTLKPSASWDLEDYNEWNLPFAKTVLIASRPEGSDTGTHYQKIPTDYYKLRVDPSVLFSIVYIEE